MRKRCLLPVVLIGLLVAATTTLAISTAQAQEYVLGPGDSLEIVIWGSVSERHSVAIAMDGAIDLPILGEIHADGLTLEQLTNELTTRFSKYIKEAHVIVNLVRPRELRVQLVGSIRTPGLYTVPPQTTLMQLLARAGGLDESADPTEVTIRRVSGETVRTDVSLLLAGDGGEDVYLSDGDTVVVPSGVIWVAVTGEVGKPGVYQLPRGSHLLQAIMAAGGTTHEAFISRVRIYETSDVENSGSKGAEVFSGPLQENPPLKEGYAVIVPRNVIWDVGLLVSIVSVLTALKSLFGL